MLIYHAFSIAPASFSVNPGFAYLAKRPIVTRGLALALIRFCGIGQRLLYNVSAGRFSPFIVGYQILASSSAGASAITLLLEKSLTFLVII